MLDIKKIREDFPILNKKILNNKNLIYLDTAASAQKPKVVIDEINSFYSNNYANVSRGVHTLSVEPTFKYEDARKKVQKFINADSEREIIFTKSATESINLIANSFASKYINDIPEDIRARYEDLIQERITTQGKWGSLEKSISETESLLEEETSDENIKILNATKEKLISMQKISD